MTLCTLEIIAIGHLTEAVFMRSTIEYAIMPNMVKI
jgi:hypothetical protein